MRCETPAALCANAGQPQLYFLLPPHVRRSEQFTFQTLPSAHLNGSLVHQNTKRSVTDHHAILQEIHHA